MKVNAQKGSWDRNRTLAAISICCNQQNSQSKNVVEVIDIAHWLKRSYTSRVALEGFGHISLYSSSSVLVTQVYVVTVNMFTGRYKRFAVYTGIGSM